MTSLRILPQTLRLAHTTPRLARTRHPILNLPASQLQLRYASSQPLEMPSYLDESEKSIFSKLQTAFQPTKLEVQDVSGGCGSMYAVEISSDKFKGLPLLKQHRLVKDALGEDVKKWHGFQLRTKVPE